MNLVQGFKYRKSVSTKHLWYKSWYIRSIILVILRKSTKYQTGVWVCVSYIKYPKSDAIYAIHTDIGRYLCPLNIFNYLIPKPMLSSLAHYHILTLIYDPLAQAYIISMNEKLLSHYDLNLHL